MYLHWSCPVLEAPLSYFSSLLYSLSSYSSLDCQSSICSLLSLSIDYSSWYIPLIESGLYIQLHQCVNSLPSSLQTSVVNVLQGCGEIGLKQQLNASGMTPTLCQLFIHQLSTTESPIEYDVYCVSRFVQDHQVDSSSMWLMLENLSQTLNHWSVFAQLFHFVIIHFPPSSTSTLVYLIDTIKRRNGFLESKTVSYLLSHCKCIRGNSRLASSFHFTSSTVSYLVFIQINPLDMGEVVLESPSQGALCDEIPYQWLLDLLDRNESGEILTENRKCQIRDVLRQFIQSSQLSVLSPLFEWLKEYPAVAPLCLRWLPSLPSLLVSQWDQVDARRLLEALALICKDKRRL